MFCVPGSPRCFFELVPVSCSAVSKGSKTFTLLRTSAPEETSVREFESMLCALLRSDKKANVICPPHARKR